MTEPLETDWVAQARILIANGGSVADVARYLGKRGDALRYALDIDGEREKQKERDKLRRERAKAEHSGVRPRAPGKRPAHAYQEERSAASAYRDPKPSRPLTLPKISLPDLDEPKVIRFVPKPRVVVSDGAERIRVIHQRMIRTGRIPERSDLLENLHR